MSSKTGIATALLIGLAALAPLSVAAAATPAACAGAACGGLVYFGTQEKAIYAARLDPRTGELTALGAVAQIERPTWLVASADRPILYSVSETGNDGKSEAGVASFAVDRATGGLTPINRVSSGGGGATHLALDPRSRTLFVANFGTGDVAALPLLADGSLAPAASMQKDYGTGPHPRQKSPHAHGVAIDPGGRYVLSADLGADRTFVYRFDPKTRMLTPGEPPFAAAPPGSGPRHIEFLPNGRFLYVDSELTGEVTGYSWNQRTGTMRPLATISTLPADYSGERSAAEMVASGDGHFLYISNRGEDSIVTFAVDPRTAALKEVQRVKSQAKVPWSFSIDPSGRWMLVANQAANLITVMKVDPASGKVTATDKSLAVPVPVNVTFIAK